MENLKLNIGSNVRFFQEGRGILQESLVLDLGISQQVVQQIESQKSKVTLQRANRIAKILRIDLELLLTHSPTNQLNNCSQSGVCNTNNFLNDKLLAQLENQNATLKEELEFLRSQLRDLMEMLKTIKK